MHHLTPKVMYGKKWMKKAERGMGQPRFTWKTAVIMEVGI